MTIEEYMKVAWATEISIEQVNGKTYFVASHPELSCRGQGMTSQEALEDLADARRSILEVMIECGDTIPMPERLRETVHIDAGVFQSLEGQVASHRRGTLVSAMPANKQVLCAA